MKTMGHRDVKTAMQYQHPELEIVRAALDHDTGADNRVGVNPKNETVREDTLYGTPKTSTSVSD